ncbi:MAG: hypothetical protein QXS75_02580 [Thermoplasmatales archaeon]
MAVLPEKVRHARMLIASSIVNPFIICRENPLFEYFSEDPRADCIQIKNSGMKYIGNREIDSSFTEADVESCSIQPFFSERQQKACKVTADDLFQFPLSGEIKVISETKKKVNDIVVSELSKASVDLTEIRFFQILKEKLCISGIKTFYEPIIAFEDNTREIWHRVEDKKIGKLGYFEISCNLDGLSSLFSETFLFSENETLISSYQSILGAIDLIRENFVEGARTSYIGTILENFRNEKLYLTNPLFPFKCHLIPGEDEVVHTGDIAIFDLWNRAGDVYIRKKVMALAGSYKAEIL